MLLLLDTRTASKENEIMRLHKYLLAGIATAFFAMPTIVSADLVLFDFRATGGNGGVVDADGNGPTSGTDFDPSAIGDAITLDGLTITLVDILAPEFEEDDGTGLFARTGNIISTGNTTNISGQDALGINNITIGNTDFDAQAASGNNGGESSDINADESLIFTFDQDVEFTSIELESFDDGIDGFEVLVNGTLIEGGLGDAVNAGAGLGALEGLTIAAGDQITFTVTGDDDTTSVRIETFEVHVKAVPEPSSLALLGLIGGVAMVRRRR